MLDLSTKGFYPVYEGERYNVTQSIEHYYTDKDWTEGINEVRISDKKTGKTLKRRGHTKQIGNFCPVFVTIGKKEYTTEEILRKTEDL